MILQFLLHKFRKNQNSGNSSIWTGTGVVLILCVMGLMKSEINYFAAIIGFVLADEIGKAVGWH